MYASSLGNDTNIGDKNKPYASLNKVLTVVPDGREIVLLSMADIPAGAAGFQLSRLVIPACRPVRERLAEIVMRC